jgi:MOSC domain-containing protein YiiM
MGRLAGIARAEVRRGPMIDLREVTIDPLAGVEGDYRGRRQGRQVTVLFRESWETACATLGAQLPWQTRLANLCVEGVEVPQPGAKLLIGKITLEVVQETKPCGLMDAAKPGLRAALTPEWRGGVCCNVVSGGIVQVGDEVRIA